MGFPYVGNKTFDFSIKKKDFFAQKRPNLAQNWHFWSIWARPCRLIQCSVGGSVGGCGARAVSRKTPIYFIYYVIHLHFLSVEGDLKDVRRKILHVIILMGHFKLSPLLFLPRKLISHHFLFSLTLARSEKEIWEQFVGIGNI